MGIFFSKSVDESCKKCPPANVRVKVAVSLDQEGQEQTALGECEFPLSFDPPEITVPITKNSDLPPSGTCFQCSSPFGPAESQAAGTSSANIVVPKIQIDTDFLTDAASMEAAVQPDLAWVDEHFPSNCQTGQAPLLSCETEMATCSQCSRPLDLNASWYSLMDRESTVSTSYKEPAKVPVSTQVTIIDRVQMNAPVSSVQEPVADPSTEVVTNFFTKLRSDIDKIQKRIDQGDAAFRRYSD